MTGLPGSNIQEIDFPPPPTQFVKKKADFVERITCRISQKIDEEDFPGGPVVRTTEARMP